jgi:hypothetical protein
MERSRFDGRTVIGWRMAFIFAHKYEANQLRRRWVNDHKQTAGRCKFAFPLP